MAARRNRLDFRRSRRLDSAGEVADVDADANLFRALAAAGCLWVTGCIGVPLVGPPAQVAIGTGVRSLRAPGSDSLDVPLQVRAAVHPLGFLPTWVDRPADFGVGYLLDYGPPALVQGVYLEASGVIVKGPSTPRTAAAATSATPTARRRWASTSRAPSCASAPRTAGRPPAACSSAFRRPSASRGAGCRASGPAPPLLRLLAYNHCGSLDAQCRAARRAAFRAPA